jgi:hypothetical protein
MKERLCFSLADAIALEDAVTSLIESKLEVLLATLAHAMRAGREAKVITPTVHSLAHHALHLGLCRRWTWTLTDLLRGRSTSTTYGWSARSSDHRPSSCATCGGGIDSSWAEPPSLRTRLTSSEPSCCGASTRTSRGSSRSGRTPPTSTGTTWARGQGMPPSRSQRCSRRHSSIGSSTASWRIVLPAGGCSRCRARAFARTTRVPRSCRSSTGRQGGSAGGGNVRFGGVRAHGSGSPIGRRAASRGGAGGETHSDRLVGGAGTRHRMGSRGSELHVSAGGRLNPWPCLWPTAALPRTLGLLQVPLTRRL